MAVIQMAPLWTACYDLARWLAERAATDSVPAVARMRIALGDEARELLAAIAAALTFPDSRAADLVAADRRALRLRTFVRLAADAGALSPRGARHVQARLDRIGRMIGGWRRQMQRGSADGAGAAAHSAAPRREPVKLPMPTEVPF